MEGREGGERERKEKEGGDEGGKEYEEEKEIFYKGRR